HTDPRSLPSLPTRRSSDLSPAAGVLAPGIHNSAFFEHSFLAREMGTTLVEGRDLVVEDNHVFMRTTRGRQRVDVVYRRIDEDFLDPLVFRRDSLLGVPGLLNAYRAGNVAIANAPGAGVADDKSVYAFMPELIKYYLGEEARLGQVPTYLGFRREDFAFMREHAAELVIKTTGDSGGYNMLMGPFATRTEIDAYVARMRKEPTNYIAQPLVALSTHPTYVDGGFAEDLAQTAWKDVLAILPSAELTRPVSAFAPLSLPYLQSFFVDGKNPYSVHYSLRKARENARAVREALTVEVFMSINETFRAVEAHGERRPDATGLRDALASTH